MTGATKDKVRQSLLRTLSWSSKGMRSQSHSVSAYYVYLINYALAHRDNTVKFLSIIYIKLGINTSGSARSDKDVIETHVRTARHNQPAHPYSLIKTFAFCKYTLFYVICRDL